MMHVFIELLDLYNNSIGIAFAMIAIVLGAIVCKYAKATTIFIIACLCLLNIAVSVAFAALVRGLSLAFLWVPLLSLQFSVIFFAFWILKLVIELVKRYRKNPSVPNA